MQTSIQAGTPGETITSLIWLPGPFMPLMSPHYTTSELPFRSLQEKFIL